MRIKYDDKIDAKYLTIKKGKIAYSKPEKEWLIFDYSKKGDVLGIEILDSSKHTIVVNSIQDKFVNYKLLDPKSNEIQLNWANGNNKISTFVVHQPNNLVFA